MTNSLSAHLLQSFKTGQSLLESFIQEKSNLSTIEKMSLEMAKCFESGNKVLSCGNGGSLCDAMHFAEEFTGRFNGDRKALPAIALSDSSYITCTANDYGYDKVFSRGVEAFGKSGDILVALSTSGNSPNVVEAVKVAKEQGLQVFLFIGKEGGQLKEQGDFEICVPGKTSDRIQEVHMMCLHILIEGVERILFPENYEE